MDRDIKKGVRKGATPFYRPSWREVKQRRIEYEQRKGNKESRRDEREEEVDKEERRGEREWREGDDKLISNTCRAEFAEEDRMETTS